MLLLYRYLIYLAIFLFSSSFVSLSFAKPSPQQLKYHYKKLSDWFLTLPQPKTVKKTRFHVTITYKGSEISFIVHSRFALCNGQNIDSHHPVIRYKNEIWIPVSMIHKINYALAFQKKQTKKFSKKIPLIILDPGHGGYDPGAIALDGTKEKDIVLSISQKVAKKLFKKGYRVLMTRHSDIFISLKDRAYFSNTRKPDLFLSIHANASTSRSSNGLECFFYSKSSYSKREKDVSSKLLESLRKNTKQEFRGVKTANFFVLKHNKFPAVLLEVGFLSNKKECHFIKKSQQLIADTIVESLEKIYPL